MQPYYLNSFKEGECLECLSAADISLRLNKRFEVDVDRVRVILKREEALSQSELVFLANSAIESANRHLTKAEQTVKRKTSSSAESNRRAKTEGPTVSYKKKVFVFFKQKCNPIYINEMNEPKQGRFLFI